MRRRPTTASLLIASLALAALSTAPVSALAAAKPGTFAGSLGVKVPKGGEAEIRAISRATGAVARARQLPRTGAFKLTLPAGSYLVLGTVVPKAGGGKVTQVRTAVSLKAGQKRAKVNIKKTKRRKKARRSSARAAYVQELGQVTPGSVAVEIPNFTGTSAGELGAVKGGLNDLMISDMFDRGKSECDLTFVEVEHRDAAIKELEFQQSPYVDPSTRLTRNFITSDVEILGTVNPAGSGQVKVEVRLRDLRTGEIHSTIEKTFPEDQLFDAMEQIAHDTADEACKLRQAYEATLHVKGDGIFATHTGSGTIDTKLVARRAATKGGAWRGTGPLQWQGLAFASKTPNCSMIDPIAPATTWSLTMLDAGDGILQVTWGLQGVDAPTASIDCAPTGKDDPDPPPIPGQPGPALTTIAPTSFEIPYAGGTQALAGGVTEGGDGFFNNGTLAITPKGITRATG